MGEQKKAPGKSLGKKLTIKPKMKDKVRSSSMGN